MARFTFRLQPVLEHKQRLEDAAQIELSRCWEAQRREEAALNEYAEAEAGAIRELERQRFTGRLDIEALQLGLRYLDILKAQIQRQTQVVQRVQRQTEAKRQELVGYMQERKMLEKLRQRQLGVFTVEQNRLEAREVDELVVMRFGYAQGQGARGKGQEARGKRQRREVRGD
ncbi:MAG: flagellar export protein FliJ [Chloroflexi bacterium]|nr:flagellar export protein FliJ [Chloroflexota bacterium]